MGLTDEEKYANKLKAAKRYRDNHPDKVRASQQKYKQDNPENTRLSNRKHYLKKLKRLGKLPFLT